MTPEREFYGYDYLKSAAANLKGRLIVVEGTDGVGRSSQISLLREWLENQGYAVATSSLKRGVLAGRGLSAAMEGHTLGEKTLNLLYATDFADRLEREIIPALRAGFIMLTDRYVYAIMVRALVRGVDPMWIRDLFSFAIVPDKVFYLQADVQNLVPRVLNARGFDYWESGLDFLPGRDYYENFIDYQRRVLAQFDTLASEYNFHRIDANDSMHQTFMTLQEEIKKVIVEMKPIALPPAMTGENANNGS